MKIKVKAFLTLRKIMGDQASLDIEAGKLTVRDLLEELSIRFGEEFRDIILETESQSGSRYIQILVNGRHYRHLPNGLDTELKEGDEVSLFPPVAGG
ncbi:MAG: MoaD family protein [Desulfobacteraceae bacterium]|jgi:molybdopterin synthase sulfur carrier subunit